MGAAGSFAAISAVTNLSTAFAQREAILAQGTVEEQRELSVARAARFQAKDAERRGRQAASTVRGRAKQDLGTQNVAIASQGIQADSGSVAGIRFETKMFGELDEIEVTNNARLEALGFEVDALTAEGRARMAKLTAKAQARQTVLTGIMGATRDAAMFGASTSKAQPHTRSKFQSQFERQGNLIDKPNRRGNLGQSGQSIRF